MAQSGGRSSFESSDIVAETKSISGRRIEQERRQRNISQAKLGSKATLSTAWIRQLESGYARVTLEAHLACVDVLGLSLLVIFIPLLFLAHGRHFPAHLLFTDLRRLEVALIDFIVNWNVVKVQIALTGSRADEVNVWTGEEVSR